MSAEISHKMKVRVLFSHMKMMIYSITTVIVAILTAQFLNEYHPLSDEWIKSIELAGYVCWGTTLGTLAPKFFSRKNVDIHEEIYDQKITTIFSILGILTFSLSSVLQAAEAIN